VWAAIGGALVGYILWLAAFWIAGDATTMSSWSPVVLIISAAFAVGTLLWARRLLRSHNVALAAFAFGLPFLPVLLTLIVLIDSHV
jgi:hypothetical protein